jgi:hypothetical protein
MSIGSNNEAAEGAWNVSLMGDPFKGHENEKPFSLLESVLRGIRDVEMLQRRHNKPPM